jgi:hypothetical protein
MPIWWFQENLDLIQPQLAHVGLLDEDNHTQAQLSFELFQMLQHQKYREWYDIVPLDESWFYFTTDYERIWLPEGTEVPDREQTTVQPRKMMVTIVWNPGGFFRIVALLKGMKFGVDYYISYILDSLAEWRRSQVGGSNRRLHVHADNACLHTVNKVTEFLAGSDMKRAPHPPDSLDLPSCDFYLFGYIKGRLASASFEEPDQPLQMIDAIFESIEEATWNACFRNGWTDWRNVVW